MTSEQWPLMRERQREVTQEAIAAVERLVDDLERRYAEAFGGAQVTIDDLIDAESQEV